MKTRLFLVRFCFKLARFLEQLPVVILRPDQLVRFSRDNYAKSNIVKSWSHPEVLLSGLMPEEKKGIEKIPTRNGSLLLLGVGGGREAIPLARLGYKVTGVDFVAEMVQSAIDNVRSCGFAMDGLVQPLTDLALPEEKFDIVWLSSGMYSCIPSREKRVAMLQQLNLALKPEGFMYCEFQFDFTRRFSGFAEAVKKLLAVLLLGNTRYEKGDMIWAGFEFLHRFPCREALTDEFAAAGFAVQSIEFPPNSVKGNVVLQSKRKPLLV